jgi:disulfide bond formation protein DsbB
MAALVFALFIPRRYSGRHEGDRRMTRLEQARWLALAVPAALLAGALGSQYVGGLYPCEMCHWQRWPHYAAVAIALLAFAARGLMPDRGRSLVWLAALAIIVSGLIGVYHAGVEADVFEGFTSCAVDAGSSGDMLADIMAKPLVQCDQVQWSFLGISLAGWNAIISLASGLLILWLSLKKPRATLR